MGISKPWDTMYSKISEMTDEVLIGTWEALGTQRWGAEDYYSREAEITLDEWGNALYSELSKRAIPMDGHGRILQAA